MQYKALSLLQPWASLAVMGQKQFETRSFNTKHRGQLLIHASLGKKSVGQDLAACWYSCLDAHFYDLPFGAIIGSVKVIDTYRSEHFFPTSNREAVHGIEISDQEYAFGDYSPGRYGWELSDPIIFDKPIPAKGMLGLWTPDEATSLLVDQALAAIQKV